MNAAVVLFYVLSCSWIDNVNLCQKKDSSDQKFTFHVEDIVSVKPYHFYWVNSISTEDKRQFINYFTGKEPKIVGCEVVIKSNTYYTDETCSNIKGK